MKMSNFRSWRILLLAAALILVPGLLQAQITTTVLLYEHIPSMEV